MCSASTYVRPQLALKVAVLFYFVKVLLLLIFSAGPDGSGHSMLVALRSVNFSSVACFGEALPYTGHFGGFRPGAGTRQGSAGGPQGGQELLVSSSRRKMLGPRR